MQFLNFWAFIIKSIFFHERKLLVLIIHLLCFQTFISASNSLDSTTPPKIRNGVIRVIEPGTFDYQSNEYVIRMRAWGVSFPARGQPGYEEAVSFSESKLIDNNITLSIKREFDERNFKVVQIFTDSGKTDFTRVSIENGIGWHNEEESGRNGSYLIAQMKAKRQELGIWKHGAIYNSISANNQIPPPLLKEIIQQNPFSSGINYWVTSFGKIHRPKCSFYERGRGKLSRRPTGTDCRICGGTNP